MVLKAAFFDLDGTLKQAPDPYRYVHERLGLWPIAQAFPRMYERGEIDSDEWIRRDVALWRGVSRCRLVQLFRDIPYVPGAAETIRALRARGVFVMVVSAGIQLHADLARADLGLDEAVANELRFEGDLCTGEVGLLVSETGKGQMVKETMARRQVGRDECLAVGDGDADIAMFECCRLGVAVQPLSDRVRAAADLVLQDADLSPFVPVLEARYPGWLSSAETDRRATWPKR